MSNNSVGPGGPVSKTLATAESDQRTDGPVATSVPTSSTNSTSERPTKYSSSTALALNSLTTYSTSTAGTPPSNTSSTIIQPSATSVRAPAAASISQASALPSSSSGSTHSLNTSTIVGVTIACAVIGAALAFGLLLCFGWRPSRSSRKDRRSESLHKLSSLQFEKSRGGSSLTDRDSINPFLVSTTMTSTLSRSSLEAFLPQQADDETIRQKFLMMFDQIELHVDNFYRERPAGLTVEQSNELSRFGTLSMMVPLASLLSSSHSKTTVIKHCLAFYVVELIAPSNNSDCLLPRRLSAILAPTSKPEDRQQPAENLSIPTALSRWRTLTAYLRPDLFDENAMAQPTNDQRIKDCAIRFTRVFAPFSASETEERQIAHLKEVLRSAVKTALWLLAQPATFTFEWRSKAELERCTTRPADMLETVPALLKTHDGSGVKVDPPQIMHAAVAKRV